MKRRIKTMILSIRRIVDLLKKNIIMLFIIGHSCINVNSVFLLNEKKKRVKKRKITNCKRLNISIHAEISVIRNWFAFTVLHFNAQSLKSKWKCLFTINSWETFFSMFYLLSSTSLSYVYISSRVCIWKKKQ
jgi:hypothetical protein